MDKSLTVLVIEDEMSIRKMLVTCLEKADFIVKEAESGKQGLELALESHPDVLLLDHFMPELSGIDTLRILRKDSWGAEVPVVLLTNDSDVQNINEAIKLGIKSYFIKVETEPAKIPQLVRDAIANK